VSGRTAAVVDLRLVGDVRRSWQVFIDPVLAGLTQDLRSHALVAVRPEHVWLLCRVEYRRVNIVEADSVCYPLSVVTCQGTAVMDWSVASLEIILKPGGKAVTGVVSPAGVGAS
jgi:hypothetical protein